MDSIKVDLSTDEVFSYTPKGQIISLPLGSTVIDFAYAIHTQVGHRMTGAKVNGRMVPLDTAIHNGNVVEILTTNQKDKGPSRDWLRIVYTQSAKSKIRSWFKKEKRADNIVIGKAVFDEELRRNRILIPHEKLAEFYLTVAKPKHNTADDMFASIGYGGTSAENFLPKVRDTYEKHYKAQADSELVDRLGKTAAHIPKNVSGDVIVEGLDNCYTKMAGCCSPIPGDDIIGFVTQGHGVSVHRRKCPNATPDNPEQAGRWVDCKWNSPDKGKNKYYVTIKIAAKARDKILNDILTATADVHAAVRSTEQIPAENETTLIFTDVMVSGRDQLIDVLSAIRRLHGVQRAERTIK
jgi:GTP pyrophosphokinase